MPETKSTVIERRLDPAALPAYHHRPFCQETDLADETLEERLKVAMPRLGGLGAVIAFDFGADGKYVVDATGPVAKLTDEDAEAACTIKVSSATMEKLLEGSLDPMLAYTLGKLKISGSMGVAMKLASSLGA